MFNCIEIKNLSKKYNITHQQGGYVALRDVLANVFKNPFQFAKHKAKQIAGLETKEEFWALKNVNFTVEQGEAIGIIGANGAGKSTLLKILSQITPPTTGEIKIQGKIASLLEVGTGFHPELTGRENIFFNGAILGMSCQEIIRKFDQIIEFSGVKKFLDTPVKYYSSGMNVRLAFAIAAHLEPDILIIDEVLAVGDAEFQKKCLGKMDEIIKKESRTILFVSHNMGAIRQLCKRCILLENGKIKFIGETNNIINKYLYKKNELLNTSLEYRKDRTGKGKVKFTNIQITNLQNSKNIKSNDGLKITLKYKSEFNETIKFARIVVTIYNNLLQPVLRFDSVITTQTFNDDLEPYGDIICETEEIPFIEGKYFVGIDFIIEEVSMDYFGMASEFNVETKYEDYNYRTKVDKTVNNYLVKYSYRKG